MAQPRTAIMPSNSSVPPTSIEATGTTQLPLSRVKKIIGVDQDIHMCSNNAAFVITLATEMFIQYLAESGHNVVKSERKPRRNIQYRDLSSAVSHIDNLEFLSDVIPRTIPLKIIKAKHSLKTPLIHTSLPNHPSSSVNNPQNGDIVDSPRGIAVHGLLESAPGPAPVPTPNPNPANGYINGFMATNRVMAPTAMLEAEAASANADEDADPSAQLRNESRTNGGDAYAHPEGSGNGVSHAGEDVEMS
ncbi:histone-like transcription factor and archaeal histone protein [Rutstroemia sp. NJR-2017a BVV2]|nr:histone-like transcription factor and archaeal histone protein [Rutstroemia sp. NJR-2017a BVV2]